MPDFFTVDADASSLLQALDRVGDVAERLVKEAALETARAVQAEARARVRRDTGRMYEAISYDEINGGYRVYLLPMSSPRGGSRPDNMGIWHEFGTRRMTAQPFLFAAARLEAGPHLRRIEHAVQAAIEEQGLGAEGA